MSPAVAPTLAIDHKHPFALTNVVLGPCRGFAIVAGFGVLPFRF